MAKEQPVARKQSRSKRDEEEKVDPGTGENGQEEQVARDEQELAGYLQERIKPGLNSGAIPLLARSLAKEIAHGEYPDGATEDDELSAEADDEPGAEVDDEDSAESEAVPDLEADLHELQAELGEDWILYFAVQGEDTWLTAEKEDASQRVEAPTASVLSKAVKVLNKGGGRPISR